MMPSLPVREGTIAPASLPVAIDYPTALALCLMPPVQDELPKYLLAPEFCGRLHFVQDLHRTMLLATLWNTGARINVALIRSDFSLVPHWPFVQLATHKQRTEKASRTAGLVPTGSQTHRGSAIRSPVCQQAADDDGLLKIPPERRNKRTGRTERCA